ncbi:DUF3221 domain-containing protein [Halobacillus sp. A5]|uniref:DUF3221 domain-containing protein n=1 Tax=Halobacillus sp. A5 TaxID=2880263 RepID=UPI0020A65ECD|nr:DUF3221 domain-containing protein [Halobacillus sp. A5]MCP3027761.1 YobA family protein [Halobacillus sp. A5]
MSRNILSKFAWIALLFLIVTACGTSENNKNLEEFTGVAAEKRVQNDSYQILVIPEVDRESIEEMNEEELLELAREEDGVYYTVEEDRFNKVEKGTEVKVTYDAEAGEEDSSPPQREAESIAFDE